MKISGKSQQPNSDKTANGPDPSGVKVRAAPHPRQREYGMGCERRYLEKKKNQS